MYARDTDSLVFSETAIKSFINEAINRIRQYEIFDDMVLLNNLTDVPILLPLKYHYLIAVYASSRLFDTDERFYEGTEKRNEFETLFGNLIEKIESGSVIIKDALGIVVANPDIATDYVTDEYYGNSSTDEEVII